MQAALSVDLEPNKDGSLDGVRAAMAWFDRVVPRGTVFATHRIATDLPEMLATLAESHEIGVHVHPREFEVEHDELARLDRERQRDLIARTRVAVADAIRVDSGTVTSFRAGRHSASPTTLAVLADLGFTVDASINVRYREHLPSAMLDRSAPFALDDSTGLGDVSGTVENLIEVPTTFARPRVLTRPWLYTRGESIVATANTLRTDRVGCSGTRAIRTALRSSAIFSMYLHPYDATNYHDLANAGSVFRKRFEDLFREDDQFISIGTLGKPRRRHRDR